MIGLGLQYAWRERTRFALTAFGIGCAVVLTVFLAGVYRGALHGSLSYIERADADIWVGRRGTWNLMRASGLLPVAAGERLRALRGVQQVEPILGALIPARVDGERRTLLAIGLDGDAALGRPRRIAAGDGRPAPGQVAIDEAFARRVGLAVGDSIDLSERRFRVAGITRETNLLVTHYAFLARADLEALLGVEGQATFFLVRVEPGSSGAVVARIGRDLPFAAAFDRETFLENNRREIAAGFLPVLWAIAVLGVVVGGAVVALMTYAAVLEKRVDYALLGAIGGGVGTRFAVVMQQALAAAVVGSAGALAALVLLQRALPFVVPEVELLIEPPLGAAAVVGAMVMAVAGSLLPARLASRVSPMEALRR